MSNQDYPYDIALSFAGEDRKYAQELAQALKARDIDVFYDEYEKATLWGKNLYTHLSEVYQKQARFCVMFLSQHYAQKLWTNHEREAAQARAFLQKNKEYILPIRLDNTEIPGILPTIGYLKWYNADSIANTIVKKLEGQSLPEPVGDTGMRWFRYLRMIFKMCFNVVRDEKFFWFGWMFFLAWWFVSYIFNYIPSGSPIVDIMVGIFTSVVGSFIGWWLFWMVMKGMSWFVKELWCRL